MINWPDLLIDALWIVGLALLLAVFSHAAYRSATSARPFRVVIAHPPYRWRAWLGATLVAGGFCFTTRDNLWQSLLWLALALAAAAQTLNSYRQQQGKTIAFANLLRRNTSENTAPSWLLITAIITIGLLLASLYAIIILPWMQPDEPRHFEVALHVARLGKPVVDGAERVPEWEQEIIRSMEDLSFWWYGFSLVGWDPANLPRSFNEIWSPAYSTAFYQPPLYYTLAGGLLSLWDDKLPLPTAILHLRLLGLSLLGLSLLGIYCTIRELLPDRPRWALAVLCFAALWPSHLAANAAVSSDILAETLTIWTLYFAVHLLRRGPGLTNLAWLLSLTILAFTTKRTALVTAFITPFTLLLWVLSANWGRWNRFRLLISLLTALLLLTAAVAATALIIRSGRLGIPQTLFADILSGKYWRNLAAFPLLKQSDALFRTFLGWFGWMRVPLPQPLYWLGGALVLFAILGGIWRLRSLPRLQLLGWQRRALLLFGLSILVQIIFAVGKQILYADWAADSIPQIRYFYPIAAPLFFFLLLGLSPWLPRPLRRYALPVGIGALCLFNIYILGFVLYPFFWL